MSNSVTTTEQRLPPVHPGEVLYEEFLRPLQLSQCGLARAVGVPPRRINEIVLRKRSVTPDTALRLSRYFGLSKRFWMEIQSRYDLDLAEDRLGEEALQAIVPLDRSACRQRADS